MSARATYHLRFGLAVLALLGCFAASANSGLAVGDTLLPAEIVYQGYRLHIRNVEVVSQRDDRFELQFELINTGRRPIQFGPGFPTHYLQTVYDNSLGIGGLMPLAPAFRSTLSASDLKLEVGEWKRSLRLWISTTERPEQLSLKTDDFEPTQPRVRRNTPTTAPVVQQPSSSPAAAPVIRSSDETVIASSSCSDLHISEVKVLLQAKGKATLQLYLTNDGSEPLFYAALPDGVTIDFYLGGSPNISASSRRIGRMDLTEQLAKLKSSSLRPTSQAVLIQRVDVSDATRYTGVITAQLDPGQLLVECDETNNMQHVLLFD